MNDLSYEVLAANCTPSGPLSLKAALSLVAVYVQKPRFNVAKSKMPALMAGQSIKVSSRAKGCKDYAIIEVSPAPAPVIEEVAEVVEEPKKVDAPKKAKKSNIPPGVRAVSWKWIVGELIAKGSLEEIEIEVVPVTEKRFNLLFNGEKLWYSPYEETANAMAQAIAAYCEGKISA